MTETWVGFDADDTLWHNESYFMESYDLFADVAAPYLATPFATAHFDFHSRVLQGVQEQPARWKRGVALLGSNVGQLVGKQYVALHFQPESKARMLELVDNVLAAFEQSIDGLEWMTDQTKAQAGASIFGVIVAVLAALLMWSLWTDPAMLRPFLGVFGDIRGMRKKLFTVFMLLGVVSVAGLAFTPLMDFTASTAA